MGFIFTCSKHARRHPNFDLNTLRQRKPSTAFYSNAPKLMKVHSINSSECASDSTSDSIHDTIMGP